MSEPPGLQHVVFIPLPAVDWLVLRVLHDVSVAILIFFRKFLKSSLSIIHLLVPSPSCVSFFCISGDVQ